jgi:hypothetical protein
MTNTEPGKTPPSRHTITLTTLELRTLTAAARLIENDPDMIEGYFDGHESAALSRAYRKLHAAQDRGA